VTDLIDTRAAKVSDLWPDAERGALYAVLDACDEPRVPALVRDLGPELAVSLYRGPAEEDLAAIAPYLVQVTPALLRWLGETLWTDPWGIFAVSESPIDELRTHFRKFLLVDAPDGDQWYFRFYDPRVLARFLPTCDATQLIAFFGPVASFAWTDLDTYGVTIATQRWFEPVSGPGIAPPPPKPRIVFRRP
jgi:hypothetical protein